ncbi:hypothetical protein [Williamsia maris]|uniref:Uncharacterized protein n=1 Tax=Williamsia maris TaxID=72806 RepID=A0ABT1HG73_9NOCA|nr:hypothetical protein [Williamsia maris]MCP2177248.1 hypothetical protein [Williamsia maris]
MTHTSRPAPTPTDRSQRTAEVASAAAACAFVLLGMSFVIAWSALGDVTASSGAFVGALALWLAGLVAAFIAAAARSRTVSIAGALALVFALAPFWGLPLMAWLS